MKLKLMGDAVAFVSDITKETFKQVKKYAPESLTLYVKDEDSKQKSPVYVMDCASINTIGSVNNAGIIFDSVTPDNKLCFTQIITTAKPASNEAKVDALTEEYASVILKINAIEKQVAKALKAKEKEIKAAEESIEVVEL